MNYFDVCFVGLSGSGKTTLSNFLQKTKIDFNINEENIKKLNEIGCFKKVTTCTTRKPRNGEIDGIDYYFLTHKQFKEDIEKGEFIENAIVFGEMYGLKKKEVNKKVDYNRIFLLDPQGIKTLKKQNPNIITIFFDISLNTSLERMDSIRKDDKKEIEKRMKDYNYFLEMKNYCDYIINGEQDINKMINQVLNILENLSRNPSK